MIPKPKWTIEFEVQVDALPANLETLRTVVEAVMRRFRERQATITINILDDAQMKKLNKQFLHTSSTTDVISFDLTDELQRQRIFELAVNADMASRQAKHHGHTVEAELALYITHGILHNLGFNDDTPERARRMHLAEDDILSKLGFGGVYFDSNSVN